MFDGVWQLNYRLTSCAGERHCVLKIGSTGETSLRLTRTGSIYTGLVNAWGQPVAVSGEMSPNGELVMSGRRSAVIPNDQEIEVVTLRVKLGEGPTTGAFEYVVRGLAPGAFFFGDIRHGVQITSAQRVFDAARFDETQFGGSWRGRYVVRQCSWVGWLWCYPFEDRNVHLFQLKLTQSGNDVEGSLTLAHIEIAVTAE